MTYAIITVGGKQYRVQEGERLLVDRLSAEEGAAFQPRVLLVGGNANTEVAPSATVTARIVGHVRGDKIRIGKYRRRTGYRRHTGFRSSLTQIEIQSIATGKQAGAKKPEPAAPTEAEPRTETEGEAAVRHAHPPKGYAELTVAQIVEQAPGWRRPNLEAALEYERAHANRKGAIAALESAIAEKEH